MSIGLIVAVSENGAIGKENTLPWRLSADLKNFKNVTLGKAVIMGRKTFESLPNGALKGRLNVIITRQKDYEAIDAKVTDSIENAILIAKQEGYDNVMVIGGAEIYKQALAKDLINELFITLVHTKVEDADTFLPEVRGIDLKKWDLVEANSYPADDKNEYPYTFEVLAKK